MTISEEDLISRCIIFSKAFRGSIHVDEVLFVFNATAPDGASHESAVLRSLAPAEGDVHRVGCGISRRQNERLGDPEPGTKRRYYCGFRTAIVGHLTLKGDGYEVRLNLDGEGGEPSHVDVALFVFSENKNDRATIKTEAGLALAEAFGPAFEFVCDEDRPDIHHPLNKDPDCLRRGIPQATSYLT